MISDLRSGKAPAKLFASGTSSPIYVCLPMAFVAVYSLEFQASFRTVYATTNTQRRLTFKQRPFQGPLL